MSLFPRPVQAPFLSLVLAFFAAGCGASEPVDTSFEPLIEPVATRQPARVPTATLAPRQSTARGTPATTAPPRKPPTVSPPDLTLRTPVATVPTVCGEVAASGTAATRSRTPLATPPPRVTAAPSPRLVSPTGVEPAARHEPLPLRRDAALERELRQILGPDIDSYAVVVKDLGSGRGASINADRVFYSASLFKVAIMYEVFNQVEQGIHDLDDELVITPYYEQFGLGPRATFVCQRLTVEDALVAMMAVSDNAAAVLLQDLAGSGNVNNTLESLGVKTHRIEEELPSTAEDFALLLDAIGRGEAVSEEYSDAMLQLLFGERIDNGVKAGVPAGTVVAHKTGNWDNATHDVAIVFAPHATYELIVLSDRDHETALTKAVSAAVWDYFERP